MAPARSDLTCPTCKRPLPEPRVTGGTPTQRWPHFPFCCERCRLVDLGRWFSGDYVIPGRPADSEELARGDQAD